MEPRYIMLLRPGAMDIDATGLRMARLLMIEEITITKLNMLDIFSLIFDTAWRVSRVKKTRWLL